jgi:polyhydroxybutyrate depolymerase
MKRRKKMVVSVALLIIGLPMALLLIAVSSFYARFYATPRANGWIVSSGQEREYLLYVPKRYDPAEATPLVISLHGAALWPAAQMETSRWNELADEFGIIIVYPSGRTLGGNGTGIRPKVWHSGSESVTADVRFIADLVDTLAATYNIDPTRIYANGLSNGGRMAFTLSCRLSNRLAAVGLVAGAQDQPWSWCADTLPVPMISFHGTADPLVPYEGRDPSWLSPRPFPNVLGWTAQWARRNGCGPDPIESVVAADVTRRAYPDCAGDAAVVLYTIRGGGHAWPGGTPMPSWLVGPTTKNVDATRAMWEFFRAHPLRAR